MPQHGRLISGDAGPVLWISREPVREIGSLWRRMAATFAASGLWPLVLESLDPLDDRPWVAGGLDPRASTSPDAHAPRLVLEEWWRGAIPEEEEDACETIAPFEREFPGLAPTSLSAGKTNALELVAAALSGRLGLVAAARPADVLAVMGWQGPANSYTDIGPLSAVLRSWEDRFGAFVVGVGFRDPDCRRATSTARRGAGPRHCR